MKKALLHYKASLLTQGPVFIGDGTELNKKEYRISPDGYAIEILDMYKVWEMMCRMGRQDQFEAFIMNPARKSIENWFSASGLNSSLLKGCVKETIKSGNGKLNLNSKDSVRNFIRDPYGKAFIPGSSLKGMLRTILLAHRLLQKPDDWETERKAILSAELSGRKWAVKRESEALEHKAFRTLGRHEKRPADAVNDVLSGLIIGDSEPLDPACLVLCPKNDLKPDDCLNTINTSRICIRPGTVIRFDITIDTALLHLDETQIMRAIEAFDGCYQSACLNHYCDIEPLTGNQVFLGGGAGFISKTVVYPLLGLHDGLDYTGKVLHSQFPKHGHLYDFSHWKTSPHTLKITQVDGKVYLFGLCRLSLKEA